MNGYMHSKHATLFEGHTFPTCTDLESASCFSSGVGKLPVVCELNETNMAMNIIYMQPNYLWGVNDASISLTCFCRHHLLFNFTLHLLQLLCLFFHLFYSSLDGLYLLQGSAYLVRFNWNSTCILLFSSFFTGSSST